MTARLAGALVFLCALRAAADGSDAARKYFSDVTLVDQNGKSVRFYSDLLKGKVVVINSFFGTCTSVCPPVTQKLVQIQNALGARFGKEVFFLSLTVDPVHDTPARLKQYADKYHAKPGWSFLTGKKEDIEWALYRVGQYSAEKNDHSTILVVGNEPKQYWKKLFSLAKTEELVKLVTAVADSS
jgi:cytochrome oxidase Cu insertion factor (SCO1/SenC/PrrC family)